MTVHPRSPIRPAYDAELVPVIDALAAGPSMALSDETLPQVRRALTGIVPGGGGVDRTAGGRIVVEEHVAPGPAGAPDLTVLVLRPASPAGPVGCLFSIHGGGMVMGDRFLGTRRLASHVADGTAVLVSVEYRLAPEHPDPAPVEDCYAGLVWTAENAAELGIDPERLIIVGSSAGGGLAAGTALLARDRGFPALSHQILFSPMLDDRMDSSSSRMLDGEGVWDRTSNLYGWTALLGERRGGPDVSPYAAPARAQDLTGLPRTYIDVGSVEILRDEALIHAGRLSQAGVSVDLHLWGGAFHGFDGYATHTAIGRAVAATRDEFIRRALGR